jgi:hypothetical protein
MVEGGGRRGLRSSGGVERRRVLDMGLRGRLVKSEVELKIDRSFG